MKKYISAILIPCLLLQLYGCYSFRPLESKEDVNAYLDSNERLNLILKNEEIISADGDKCKAITQQKFIFFGTGTLIDKKSKESKTFKGEIDQSTIDSVKSVLLDSKEYIITWLKDTTRISFEKPDVIFHSNLNPDSNYLLITNSESPRIINVNDLKAVEVEEINLAVVIPLGVLGLALMVGMIALAKNLPTGPILPE